MHAARSATSGPPVVWRSTAGGGFRHANHHCSGGCGARIGTNASPLCSVGAAVRPSVLSPSEEQRPGHLGGPRLARPPVDRRGRLSTVLRWLKASPLPSRAFDQLRNGATPISSRGGHSLLDCFIEGPLPGFLTPVGLAVLVVGRTRRYPFPTSRSHRSASPCYIEYRRRPFGQGLESAHQSGPISR